MNTYLTAALSHPLAHPPHVRRHSPVPPALLPILPSFPQALLDALRLWDFSAEALSEEGGSVDASLLALTMPPIRADLAMREAYCAAAAAAVAAGASPLPRLASPLHVFGGASERSFSPAHLAAWSKFAPAADDGTAAPVAEPASAEAPFDASSHFSCTLLAGGHFYVDEPSSRATLVDRISSVVSAALAALPRSVASGPPLPPPSSLSYAHEMVEACARDRPDAVALVDVRARWSYAEAVADAKLIGAWVVLEGVAPGKVVALLMQHCAEFLLAQIGVAMSGGACFALEAHFGPQMLKGLMDDTSPLAAIASPAHAPRLAAALPARVNTLQISHQVEWRALCSAPRCCCTASR